MNKYDGDRVLSLGRHGEEVPAPPNGYFSPWMIRGIFSRDNLRINSIINF